METSEFTPGRANLARVNSRVYIDVESRVYRTSNEGCVNSRVDMEDAREPVTIVSPSAAASLPRPTDNLATPIMARHDVEVEYYAPRGFDPQTPHDRDELYFIARGEGWFTIGKQRHRFAPGDMIFVPAGDEHRFEDFSADFSAWVVFFGPRLA